MTTRADIGNYLKLLDSGFTFHLDGEERNLLPTLEENEKWVKRYETELEVARTTYWQTLKDLSLRKVLSRIIISLDTLENNSMDLPDSSILDQMVMSSQGIRSFAGKLDDYVHEVVDLQKV